MVLLTQGLWACAVYRFFYPLVRARNAQLRRVAHWVSIPTVKWIEVVAGISMPPECEIGPGLHIDHFGGIVINPRARIGCNCNIAHGVTIGSGGRGQRDARSREGVPVIGDRVYIGPGAVVFGPISIGDDVAIGANATVSTSVPARSLVVGVPGRVVGSHGSFEYVQFLGMETDAARIASMRQMLPDPSRAAATAGEGT